MRSRLAVKNSGLGHIRCRSTALAKALMVDMALRVLDRVDGCAVSHKEQVGEAICTTGCAKPQLFKLLGCVMAQCLNFHAPLPHPTSLSPSICGPSISSNQTGYLHGCDAEHQHQRACTRIHAVYETHVWCYVSCILCLNASLWCCLHLWLCRSNTAQHVTRTQFMLCPSASTAVLVL